eukprot:scaffold319_cov244-Pinguiococcus_pyrenoidosus.AAC.13
MADPGARGESVRSLGHRRDRHPADSHLRSKVSIGFDGSPIPLDPNLPIQCVLWALQDRSPAFALNYWARTLRS